MKRIAVVLTGLVLLFSACEQPTDEDTTQKLPSLTIRNESSYVLTDVKFSGISFATSGNDLPVSSQSVKQLKANDLNKAGYITFTRKDIGIACRTEAITIPDEDYTFIFTNNTSVEEQANSNNRNSLAQITFLSEVTVGYGTLPVAKNQTLNLGEGVTNRSKQFDFTLKNTGVGKLLLSAGGTEPVRISGDTENVFSIVQQPSSAEIAPNGSLPFKIGFIPKAVQEYTATVTIISNDQSGNFTFSITAAGTPPKPVAEVYFNNNAVSQNGTIDAGEVIITYSKNITVEIRNTGTEVLSLDTANITITDDNAAVFTKITNPGGSISENGQSSFIIKCEPTEPGTNSAIVTIPTNDNSRNPIIIILQMTAVKGSAVLELSQGTTVITNNSLTPFDFGQVETVTNKSLAFTIKNKGNIALELTATPAVASSNAAFVIQTQPANKTISPGAEVSFLLQYAPSAEAEENASITINNNSDDMVFTLNVKGTGYVKRPQIVVQQGVSTISPHGEHSFGTVAAGKSSDITFTVRNSGDANLTFTTVDGNRINLTDDASGFFSVTQQPSASAVVTPTATTTFIIRFSPTTVGSNFTATVLIKTNSRNNDEFAFTIKGTARAANSEARLSGMQFSTGTLVPEFNSSIYEYDLRIQSGPTLINVRPTSVDSNITTVRVNGVSQASGVLSQDIILASNNTVTIEVYAEDATTTATYTVNLKIIKTWEKLHGASGRRYGIFRAISNGQGGIYAGGYTNDYTAALFNIDQNGNIQNTFTFYSYDSTVGPQALGMDYNDFYSVYNMDEFYGYYITKTTSPSVSPNRIETSYLEYNNYYVKMGAAGIVRDSNGYYFVAGISGYAAKATDANYTAGIFVNRHYYDGSLEKGRTSIPVNITGIRTDSLGISGMTLLSNGDVLLYGQADTTAGRTVAIALAVNVSATNAATWSIRWSNTYEITNKKSRFLNHFGDNASNIILVGDTDDGGFVVKFPRSATTAAAAKPSGWPKVIAGTYGGFTSGLALSDGSGYIFVGSVGWGGGTGPYGGEDAWIVKTDLNVTNKTWEKFFGGTGNDWGSAIVEQADCFILGGATNSPVIAGQTRKGTEDIYILKINKDGTMD